MNKGEALRTAALLRIGEQEARMARQKELIANLAARGASIVVARRLLATVEDTLKTLRACLSQPN